MEVYKAVLLCDEYVLNDNPETFSRALDALKKAATIEPDCGQIWSMHARLLANSYSHDAQSDEGVLETAFEYARNGIRLSPNDRRARVIMAFIHLLRNDLTSGLAEAEQALNLAPQTLFMLDAIGFLLIHLGDWQRGPALIKKVMQLNPFYANYCHFALWNNHFRQKDYAQAYQETMRLKKEATFWGPLAKAATLGLLGRYDEGERFGEKLLEIKPDFPEKARDLIGHYIKFEDIFERLVEGLNKVGLGIEK
jgi:tetratricopeptide (TPR) repeat protein